MMPLNIEATEISCLEALADEVNEGKVVE